MHSFAPFFKLNISAKNRQHFFAIEYWSSDFFRFCRQILHFSANFWWFFFRISRQFPEKSVVCRFFNQICENKLQKCRNFWNLWKLFIIIHYHSFVSLVAGRCRRSTSLQCRCSWPGLFILWHPRLAGEGIFFSVYLPTCTLYPHYSLPTLLFTPTLYLFTPGSTKQCLSGLVVDVRLDGLQQVLPCLDLFRLFSRNLPHHSNVRYFTKLPKTSLLFSPMIHGTKICLQ